MKHLKTYESQSKGRDIIYTFNAKARTLTEFGKYEYTVHLLQGNSKVDNNDGYSYDGLVISIDDTPGSWFVSTFLHYNSILNISDKINIDGSWTCTNRREIREELLEWLKNEYPTWKASKQYNL